MNRSARRMFGGDLADFIGEPMGIVATARSRPSVSPHALPRRAGRRPGRDLRVPRARAATGASSGSSATPSPPARDHGGRQLTYALLDIERRRQAEARMSEAQASLQRVIEAAPLAIALLDARTPARRAGQRGRRRAPSATRPSGLVGRTPEADLRRRARRRAARATCERALARERA